MPLEGYEPLPDSRAERVAVYQRDPVEYCRRLSGADLNRLLRAVGKMRGVSDRQGEVWFYENWRDQRRAMRKDVDGEQVCTETDAEAG